MSRRPIAARSTGWAMAVSAALARQGISPNTISLFSIVFAAAGAALIGFGEHWTSWFLAALCVQLRLICNLLDGMVAVEHGRKSPLGPIWNEFPDRVADTLFLVPLGYAAGIPWLGWAAALLAALTAYVRVFGGALGLAQDFSGVMAKQRRMAVVTAGLAGQAILQPWTHTRWTLLLALAVVAAGSLVTCLTRSLRIARALESASSSGSRTG